MSPGLTTLECGGKGSKISILPALVIPLVDYRCFSSYLSTSWNEQGPSKQQFPGAHAS